jgi:hypothetical protein
VKPAFISHKIEVIRVQRGGTHMLLKCPKTQRWREELLNTWPSMNEEIALRKLLTGNKATELRNLGDLGNKMKCKWKTN